MKTVRLIRFLPFVALALIAVGCGQSTTSPAGTQPNTRPAWQPDSALMDKLGEPVDLGGYLVQPPKGYPKTMPQGGPPGLNVFAWGGTSRPDGTAPMFMISIGKPPAGERIPPLDKYLSISLEGIKKRRQDWSETPGEGGSINGLTFLRARWNGTEPAKGWKMHGIMYVAINEGTVIQISTQDTEPHDQEALKIGEAAALTFIKK